MGYSDAECYICRAYCVSEDDRSSYDICTECMPYLRWSSHGKNIIEDEFCNICGRKRGLLFSGFTLCSGHKTEVIPDRHFEFGNINELPQICGEIRKCNIRQVEIRKDKTTVVIDLYCEHFNVRLGIVVTPGERIPIDPKNMIWGRLFDLNKGKFEDNVNVTLIKVLQ